MERMRLGDMAPASQGQDVPLPDIGNVPLRLNALVVALNEVVNDPFPDRLVANRQLIFP